jgi:tetratricopeptide (TPR) repeat protein
MRLTLSVITTAVVLLATGTFATARAEDASVDRLINKLPPPEKVVQADPAARDPLATQIVAAIKKMNFGNAYAMSQKLASRYPKSAGAHGLHGQLALLMRHYAEATDAFHRAIAIEPNFGFAYVGLALSEASQNHISAAMSNFRQVARLFPNEDVGWIGMSACAERLGKKNDSLQYARRAAAVAPSSYAAWLQLSRSERNAGNRQAAATALARANEIQRKESKSKKRS